MRDLWRNSGICSEKVKNAGEKKKFMPTTPQQHIWYPSAISAAATVAGSFGQLRLAEPSLPPPQCCKAEQVHWCATTPWISQTHAEFPLDHPGRITSTWNLKNFVWVTLCMEFLSLKICHFKTKLFLKTKWNTWKRYPYDHRPFYFINSCACVFLMLNLSPGKTTAKKNSALIFFQTT